MKIQGHLRDYPLQTLIEVLAHRRETGRLRIAFEPEPATLHFLEGQLVDARMSNLEGSAAINLALSLEGAPFDFDSEIQPRKSQIGSHERAMISRLLGVQLNLSIEQNGRFDGNKPTNQIQNGSAKVLERSLPPKLQTGAIVTRSQTQALAENPPSRDDFQLTLLDPADKPPRPLQQKLLRAAALILVVAMPIASVMTIKLSQGSEDTVIPAIDDQRSPREQTRTYHEPAPSLADFRQNAGALPLSGKPTKATRSKESYATKTIAEPESSKVISKITNATDGSGSVPEAPSNSFSAPESRPSRTTTVVLEVMIEQGRVTEARVKNRRKGFEALEASALRIVRQRRYSRDSTGTASVSIELIVNQ